MKTIPVCLLLIIFCNIFKSYGQTEPKESFYKLSFNSLDGEKIDFSRFKGKKILIVNTASKCGFTPQYGDLQLLSDKYKDELVVIGFPSNDFGKQEPGSNEDIGEFCQKNYGVTFLMMEKSDVKGDNRNAVYQWLTDKDKNGWNTKAPSWNFCKYLVDENGRLLKFFPSKVKPLSKDVTDLL